MSAQSPSVTQLPLANSVTRQAGESFAHWAGKAAVVEWLETHPGIEGEIQTERKVEDLIADVRCNLTDSPPTIPEKVVIEVQTRHSSKDIVRNTRRYHRFGYCVYWVFLQNAAHKRRNAERALEDVMEPTPSLGIISLEDGELRLGQPITPTNLEEPEIRFCYNELYVPTYERFESTFDHGDFTAQGEKTISLISIDETLYLSEEVDATGQRTLPVKITGYDSCYTLFTQEDLHRASPVRGPP